MSNFVIYTYNEVQSMYKNVYKTLYNVNIIQLMYKNLIVHVDLICKIGGVYVKG